MAYDPDLAERVRDALMVTGWSPTEKKMFGGLSFLVDGNLCCGVMGDDLFVRVGPLAVRGALGEPGTRPFDMGRGPSAAMVVVAADGVATDQALASWVERGLAFATTLPAK